MKKYLLLGAGFSADFGGFLAKKMGEIIFDHPNINKSYILRDRLRSNIRDFEKVYTEITNSRDIAISSEEIMAFKNVIKEVYHLQNNNIVEFIRKVPKQNLERTVRFLNRFDLIFTLNQDILLELLLSHRIFGEVEPICEKYNITEKNKTLLEIKNNINSNPTAISNERIIKLHGSYDWVSQDNDLLIIGSNKSETLSGIFKEMYAIFKEKISESNSKTMVIGFSAGNDTHIQTLLKQSPELHMVNPEMNDIIMDSSCIRGIYTTTFLETLKKPYKILIQKNFFD